MLIFSTSQLANAVWHMGYYRMWQLTMHCHLSPCHLKLPRIFHWYILYQILEALTLTLPSHFNPSIPLMPLLSQTISHFFLHLPSPWNQLGSVKWSVLMDTGVRLQTPMILLKYYTVSQKMGHTLYNLSQKLLTHRSTSCSSYHGSNCTSTTSTKFKQ